MVCAQIPLKLGSEIVTNSTFVILFHTVLEPAMNFPNANANKSLFQGQGNFLIIGCISRKYQGTFSSQGRLQTTLNIVLILSELNRMHFRQSIKFSTYRMLLPADPCFWIKHSCLVGSYHLLSQEKNRLEKQQPSKHWPGFASRLSSSCVYHHILFLCMVCGFG